MATAMDGVTAMVMDGAMATQRQRRWTARWRRDSDRRRDGDATAATATAMEGVMAMGAAKACDSGAAATAMDGATATATDGATATRRQRRWTATEGATVTRQRQRQRQWKVRWQWAARR